MSNASNNESFEPPTQFSVTSYGPYTILSDKLRPPTQISMTSYGHLTQNSLTSYGPPSLISVTIGTRILKLKLKMRVKIKIFRLDPEVILHHICRDKLSLDSPFKEKVSG